jgi:hypothetical protein
METMTFPRIVPRIPGFLATTKGDLLFTENQQSYWELLMFHLLSLCLIDLVSF